MATTQQPYRAVVLAGGADRLTGGYGVHNALEGPLALFALPWSWYSCTPSLVLAGEADRLL